MKKSPPQAPLDFRFRTDPFPLKNVKKFERGDLYRMLNACDLPIGTPHISYIQTPTYTPFSTYRYTHLPTNMDTPTNKHMCRYVHPNLHPHNYLYTSPI